MRVVPLITFATACLLAPDVGAQTIVRPAQKVAVRPDIAASIKAIPRPVLKARSALPLREDRSGVFTPADLKGVNERDLAKGRVIGVAQLSASNALGVPAGTYDYVVMKSDNAWRLYAVSGGRVFKEARQVSVGTGKPDGFHPKAAANSRDNAFDIGSALTLQPDRISFIDSADGRGRFQHITVTGTDSHGHRVPVVATVQHYVMLPGKTYYVNDPYDVAPLPTVQPDGSWPKVDDASVYRAGEGWVDLSPPRYHDGTNVLRFLAPGFQVAYLLIEYPCSGCPADPFGSSPTISWGW